MFWQCLKCLRWPTSASAQVRIIIIIMFIKIKPSAELIYNIHIWLTWETMSAFPEKRMPDCMLTSREGGGGEGAEFCIPFNCCNCCTFFWIWLNHRLFRSHKMQTEMTVLQFLHVIFTLVKICQIRLRIRATISIDINLMYFRSLLSGNLRYV